MAPLIKSPRKLIEVALPLDVINVAADREKPRLSGISRGSKYPPAEPGALGGCASKAL